MDLRTYYVYLLREGPAWTAEMPPELQDLQARHVAYTRTTWWRPARRRPLAP